MPAYTFAGAKTTFSRNAMRQQLQAEIASEQRSASRAGKNKTRKGRLGRRRKKATKKRGTAVKCCNASTAAKAEAPRPQSRQRVIDVRLMPHSISTDAGPGSYSTDALGGFGSLNKAGRRRNVPSVRQSRVAGQVLLFGWLGAFLCSGQRSLTHVRSVRFLFVCCSCVCFFLSFFCCSVPFRPSCRARAGQRTQRSWPPTPPLKQALPHPAPVPTAKTAPPPERSLCCRGIAPAHARCLLVPQGQRCVVMCFATTAMPQVCVCMLRREAVVWFSYHDVCVQAPMAPDVTPVSQLVTPSAVDYDAHVARDRTSKSKRSTGFRFGTTQRGAIEVPIG